VSALIETLPARVMSRIAAGVELCLSWAVMSFASDHSGTNGTSPQNSHGRTMSDPGGTTRPYKKTNDSSTI
jgi:hypothetical protein